MDAKVHPLLHRFWWVLPAIASITVLGGSLYLWSRPKVQEASPITSIERKTVTALGRLEPQGEVIRVSAPSSMEGSRVDQLLVKEGDRVQTGQTIAILNTRDQQQAAVSEAEAAVQVTEKKLAVVQAGAKQGEIEAQRATIAQLEAESRGDIDSQTATVARLEAALQNANAEAARYQLLYQSGAISASQADSKQLAAETARRSVQEAQALLARKQLGSPQQIKQAKANLERISEVRPTDVEQAQAELTQAIAAAKQAKAKLLQSYIRAPYTGTILKIRAHPGELIAADQGVVEFGKTLQMVAIAEVYQNDIHSIKRGQLAQITSDSLPKQMLKGTVETIGLQVKRQSVVNADPSANIDARVVEVTVRLDPASSQYVQTLTALQVTVRIAL